MNNTTIIAALVAPVIAAIGGKCVGWLDRRAARFILTTMPNGRLKSLLLSSTDSRWNKLVGGPGDARQPGERVRRRSGE